MKCPACGHVNAFDSNFCSRCAAKISAYSTPLDPNTGRVVNVGYPGVPQQSNATTVLVLGILSIVVCGVMGPIAWSMGRKELDRISIGEAPQSGYGMTNAGYICGIVGTVLLGLTMLWVLFVLVMMVS